MNFKLKPLTVATMFALAGISTTGFAQDADQASDDAAEVLEEVIITGSRIHQDPLDQRSPVQFVSEQDMDVTGTLSLGDYLQRLPIAGSSINRLNNSSGNLGFPPDGSGIGAGASEIDLRYLGSKRTLVLVDGRRWIRGASASGVAGAVDLNTIPANAIKSIEILQDGASAIYGSDAMGGVVNLITQDNYEGFKATAYYGQFDEGDGESVEADVRWGAEGDRARAFIDISFVDQKEVDAGDRAISSYPVPQFMHGGSSGVPEGRFVFTDPIAGSLSITPDVTNPTYDSNCPTCDDFHAFNFFVDSFNYQPYNFLLTPSTRVSIFAKSEYDITDNVTFRILASYNNRESTSRAAPEPLFIGPDSGSDAHLSNVVWPADHPYNPFGFDLGPGTLSFMGRRPIEAGPRIFDQTVDTYYISAGLDGSFGSSREVFWDFTAIWAENDANQVKQGAFNSRRIATALGDPDVCAATAGCVPFNIVGPGSMTQEMLDYVTFLQKDHSDQQLTDFSFNLTGSAPGLSAGDIGWAVGYEYRDEDGNFVPDAAVAAGETAGVPASPTSGGFEADELYGEVIVPLFEGSNGMRAEASGAIRYSDYDLFDSETIYDVGFNFAPAENVVFRASFSEGYRTPHIGELFNTGSRFDASINDPCNSAIGTPPANCQALGVPPDYVELNPQVSVTTGGNSSLKPETSDTVTLGFTWDIPMDGSNAIEDMLLEFNYYDIEIDDAVQPPDAQDVLDLCVQTLDPFYCDNVSRTAGGTITRIDGVLLNIGSIETSGFDWKFEVQFAETSWGNFRVQWLNTHLSDYTEIFTTPSGNMSVSREGTELGSPERAFFEWKSNLNLDWYRNDWSAHLGLRYLDSVTEACGGLQADLGYGSQLCSDFPTSNEIGSTLWTDLQVTFSPDLPGDGQWSFSLGADNVFDEDIPYCYTCDLNTMDGTVYPIPGTFWYARATYEID